MAFTTLGSARVDTSPSSLSALTAILRRMRRMILPLRVFGRPAARTSMPAAEQAPRIRLLSECENWPQLGFCTRASRTPCAQRNSLRCEGRDTEMAHCSCTAAGQIHAL